MNQYQTIVLAIRGIHCQSCESRVTQTLAKLAGVSSVSVSLQEGMAWVRGEQLSDAALVAAIEQLGFQAQAAR